MLERKISALPESQFADLFSLLESATFSSSSTSSCVEIEMSSLDAATLRKIERFVVDRRLPGKKIVEKPAVPESDASATGLLDARKHNVCRYAWRDLCFFCA